MRNKKMLRFMQEIVDGYFETDLPTVKWETLKDNVAGFADKKKNVIFINPKQDPSLPPFASHVTEGYYKPKTGMRLKEEEIYFATLFHEIGHFKVNYEVPEEYKEIKRRVEEDWPGQIDLQCYQVEYELERKEGEEYEEYMGRAEDIKTFIRCGSTMSEHIEVVEWGLKEFRKQRKRIKKFLTGC